VQLSSPEVCHQETLEPIEIPLAVGGSVRGTSGWSQRCSYLPLSVLLMLLLVLLVLLLLM
jgi:hypothetical protein